MTFDFTYTQHYGVNSSWVDDVYYNANERYAVIDLDDNMYRYDNVSKDDVEALVKAPSVGAYYNTQFKHAFGPGTYLGNWNSVDYDVVEEVKDTINVGNSTGPTLTVQAGQIYLAGGQPVANDFNTPPVTKEFSLKANPNKERYGDGEPMYVQADSTKEYSLKTPEPEVKLESNDFNDTTVSTVYFTLDDYDKVYEYRSDKLSVEGAIEEVNAYVSRLGGRGKVVKVVFEFE